MESSRFRLSICLKRLFNDERAQCYVSAEGHRPVRWLRCRLARLFGPNLATAALLCRGHLLPDDEPLALLAHDDRVDVVPVQFQIPCERDNFQLGTSPYHDHKTTRAKLQHDGTNANSQTEVFANEEFDYDTTDGNIRISNDISFREFCSGYPEQSACKKAECEKSLLDDTLKESKSFCQLEQYKQQALHLLDQYDQEQSKMDPKRKRRRVRKRRRLQEQAEQINYDSSLSDAALEEHPGGVARNTSVEVRPARLVQPLPAPTSVQ